jgi:ankyrin repeat protein
MVSIIAILLVASSSSMVAAQKSMTQSAMTQSAMFQAIYQGKIDAVQSVIDSGVDINMRYQVEGKRGGVTPLMMAVAYLSTPEMIQFLIDSGAEVDAHCDKQSTALIYCLGIGSKVFKTLLPVAPGSTRTDAELDRAKYEIVKVLLNNGADVNWARHESDHSDPANRMVRPRDRTDGTTPLAWYLRRGHTMGRRDWICTPEMVQLLIAHGAEVNVSTTDGETPLMFAVDQGPEMVQLLLDAGAKIEAEDRAGMTALSHAAWRENETSLGSAKLLLANGAEINHLSKAGYPLTLACTSGNTSMVELLMEHGADVNPSGGFTPLMGAARGSQVELIEWLLKEGADPNAVNRNGWTALMEAAELENTDGEIIAMLIEAGAKVNARCAEGKTALMCALMWAQPATIRQLLDLGADVRMKDEDGSTALMLAAEESSVEVVAMLVEAGAKVDATNAEGKSALMWAAKFARPAAVRLLLDQGADVRMKDKAGSTVLMIAAQGYSEESRVEVVAMLVEAGAKVNARGAEGKTALMCAAMESMPGVVRQLLDLGADAQLKDKAGKWAIDYARDNFALSGSPVLQQLKTVF